MSDTEPRRVLVNNAFGEIPNTAPDFKPREIVHAILTVDASQPGNLLFRAVKPKDDPPPLRTDDGQNAAAGAETIEDYAQRIAGQQGAIFAIQDAPSPYDIIVKQQCWVLLQLDPRITNWQFTKDEPGCTTKSAANKRNCGLRHVYADKIGAPGEVVTADGCQVLYFGVVRRGKNCKPPVSGKPPGEMFNFHIEFLQTDGGETKRLPVIFDPDIKNDSDTNTIPPGE